MDLATMQSTLREMMEVEQEDWPDTLLNASIREGYERIIAKDSRWPFFEGRWSLSVVEGTDEYDLSLFGDIQEITSMRMAGGNRLAFTDEATAEVRWSHPGPPMEWSRWGTTVKLWPTPTGAGELVLRGYKAPALFVNNASWTPDLPERFHPLLLDWALGNEYQRQDDVEMMTSYRNKFEEQLTHLQRSAFAAPSASPLVVGGNSRRSREWWQ